MEQYYHLITQKAQSSGTTPTSISSLVIDDIALSTSSSPCQPVDVTFPVRYYSGKARSFNPQWFRLYPLLEYSISSDAAFCYACRLFGSTNVCSSRPERAFTLVGFRDCKHATGTKGIHINHHNSLSHKQAVVAWQQFKTSLERGSVAEQLVSTRAVQIERNIHYIKSIAEVLLLCSKQEISFRGHNESVDSKNKGNFMQILGLLGKHDKVVEDRLFYGPRNAKYTSHTIQNNIIAVMATLVRNKIV